MSRAWTKVSNDSQALATLMSCFFKWRENYVHQLVRLTRFNNIWRTLEFCGMEKTLESFNLRREIWLMHANTTKLTLWRYFVLQFVAVPFLSQPVAQWRIHWPKDSYIVKNALAVGLISRTKTSLALQLPILLLGRIFGDVLSGKPFWNYSCSVILWEDKWSTSNGRELAFVPKDNRHWSTARLANGQISVHFGSKQNLELTFRSLWECALSLHSKSII